MTPHYHQTLSSSDIRLLTKDRLSNSVSLPLENVGQTVLGAPRAAGNHRGDLPGHHVGEREGGGGAGLRLGRQEHRAVHPQEAGGLLSKGHTHTYSLMGSGQCSGSRI